MALACTPLTAGTVATTLMQEDAPCGLVSRFIAAAWLASRAGRKHLALGQDWEQARLVGQQPLRRERQTETAEAGDEEFVSLPPGESVSADDSLLEALSRGEEDAFCALLERYHTSLLRVAGLYVSSHALAEEVVQDTWLGFVGSLPRFERRCSLKTWLFTILIRCAARTSKHERRSIPFSAVWNADAAPGEPALEPDRFFPPKHRWNGIWRLDRAEAVPTGWADVPEEQLLS